MGMRNKITEISDRIISGGSIEYEEALLLTELTGGDLFFLFAEANRIREHFVGKKIFLCSIINAKSGRCPEDCVFCSQSAFSRTDAPVFPLVDEDKIVSSASDAAANGSSCFGIVT